MTAVATPAGAVSHGTVHWPTIAWSKVYRNVRRLQARIVEATRAGRWGKVKALQRLLTHSFSGRCLAVRRVTENQGQRTAGVDQILWDTPEKKATAVQELKQKGYQAQPLRRVYIPKSTNHPKMRALGIPTMADRAQQALHLLALDPIAETTGDPNSYGFRRERSTADAIAQCYLLFRRKITPLWILRCDIRACFDEISHEWLVKHIPMDKAILHQWLKAGFLEKQVFHRTEAGTPQGGVASPVLANLTLDGLEKVLRQKYPKTKQTDPAKVHRVRYADDLLVTGTTPRLLETEVKPLVEEFLKERGLVLSPEKTHIVHIETGFDFLGQNIRQHHGKLLIKPSEKNIQIFLKKVRGIIKAHAQARAGNLIRQLNPVIRGWANYHRHVVSKVIFHQVDHAIFQALWSWAKRRHPNKSRRWLKEKYFPSTLRSNWTFSGTVMGKRAETQVIRLFKAADVPIQRHLKIQSTANPYDRTWEMYFEKRTDQKMKADLKQRRKLLRLWLDQNGLCPICRQKITKQTGWHNHHIVWRTHGGSEKTENRILLHPECHRQVHSQGLMVVKPRPATGVRKA